MISNEKQGDCNNIRETMSKALKNNKNNNKQIQKQWQSMTIKKHWKKWRAMKGNEMQWKTMKHIRKTMKAMKIKEKQWRTIKNNWK